MIRLRRSIATCVVVLSATAAHAADESISLGARGVLGGKAVAAQLVVRAPRSTSTNYRVLLSGPVTERSLALSLPAGKTAAGFSINTTPVRQKTDVEICVTSKPPACDAKATLAVLPPRLETLRFTSTTVTSGTAFQGEVVLDGPAPPGGFEVDLAQSPVATSSPTTGPCPQFPAGALAPDSVLIPAGLGSKKFTIPTFFLSLSRPRSGSAEVNQLQVLVAARAAGIEKSQMLTVQKLKFASFTIQPTSGVIPLNATVSFSLNGPAPTNQTVQAVQARTPTGRGSVTGQGTLAAGQQSGSFPIVIDGGHGIVQLYTECVEPSRTFPVQLFAPPQ